MSLSIQDIERLEKSGWSKADIMALAGGNQVTSKTVAVQATETMKANAVDLSTVEAVNIQAKRLKVKITMPFGLFKAKKGYHGLTSKEPTGYGQMAKFFLKVAGLTGQADAEKAVEMVADCKSQVENLTEALTTATEFLKFSEALAKDLMKGKK
jgi:hypothetical protein